MEEVPYSFYCPITTDLLKEPVTLGSTGHIFEREAIADWLAHHNTHPLTGEVLSNASLAPNFALRDAIMDFMRRMSGRVIQPSELVVHEHLGAGSSKEVYRASFRGAPAALLRLRHAAHTDAEAQTFVRLGCHPHLVRFFGRAQVIHIICTRQDLGVTQIVVM